MSTSTRLISAALTCCWARRYVFLKESWGFPLFPKTYQRRQKGRKDVFGNGGIRKYLRSKFTNWNLLVKLHASDVWVHQVRVGVMEDENKALKLRVRRCAGTIGTGGAYDWPPGGDWVDWLVWSYFPDASVGALKFSPFFAGCFEEVLALGHAVCRCAWKWSWLWNRKGISENDIPMNITGKYNKIQIFMIFLP